MWIGSVFFCVFPPLCEDDGQGKKAPGTAGGNRSLSRLRAAVLQLPGRTEQLFQNPVSPPLQVLHHLPLGGSFLIGGGEKTGQILLFFRGGKEKDGFFHSFPVGSWHPGAGGLHGSLEKTVCLNQLIQKAVVRQEAGEHPDLLGTDTVKVRPGVFAQVGTQLSKEHVPRLKPVFHRHGGRHLRAAQNPSRVRFQMLQLDAGKGSGSGAGRYFIIF